jgi:predicted CoA-substrate-specific enzyme activase
MDNMKYTIGIDIGSISIELAVLGTNTDNVSILKNRENGNLFFVPSNNSLSYQNNHIFLLSNYLRHQGSPIKTTLDLLKELLKIIPFERISGFWVTGSGGRLCANELGFQYLNEYRAVAEGVGRIFPEVHTIFEIGGESSKYIRLSREDNDEIQIIDYETNGECAAGTGSFFDQQVERLRYRIEDVGDIVFNVNKSASIAGRCSVFAKSDMIHAQQRGYEPPQILKGLCEAIVRNFKGSMTKGKKIESDVAFIGGVAANAGVVDAFKKLFNIKSENLVIPELYAWTGAIGAALTGFKQNSRKPQISISKFEIKQKNKYPSTKILSMDRVKLLRDKYTSKSVLNNGKITGFLGIDIGSVSTNLALITTNGDLIHGIYRMTEGRPIEVVDDSLKEMASVAGNRIMINGVGTTGSGRELIGLLVGADVIKDEITAHKTGAVFVANKYLNHQVDTIFEIGGQDSKFIALNNGDVIDFSLNEACAAGTGSFLEEQAGRLGISIKEEFSDLALQSNHPLKLGERCTVFMEKELIPYLQRGVPKSDIAAGLAFSVVQNYLNRVVKKRKIGEVIFFQGGTAYNNAVAAAFATILERQIVVPPHNGIMGAVGAALLAKKHSEMNKFSNFRGWDLSKIQWHLNEFTCQICTNQCLIQEFDIEGQKSYWGDKCSKQYRKSTKTSKKSIIINLIHQYNEQLFLNNKAEKKVCKRVDGRIGFPVALHFFDRLPFWKTYFETFGFEVVLSGSTKKGIINNGIESTVAEPCFPLQVAHGHIKQLMNQDVDFIFFPNLINEEDSNNSVASFICPWGQTAPLVAKYSPVLAKCRDRLLLPTVHFRDGVKIVERQLRKEMIRFGIGKKENLYAIQMAYQVQNEFNNKIIRAGKQELNNLHTIQEPAVVLLGRPYNLYDSGINLNIPIKLKEIYGVNVIPMNFLPVQLININKIHNHMFWNYGRRIIQAARYTRDYPHLHIIYLSNFKCGPDSYIRHYIEDACKKPFLFLQLDSHSNDAGIMTRIEAFLESKGII